MNRLPAGWAGAARLACLVLVLAFGGAPAAQERLAPEAVADALEKDFAAAVQAYLDGNYERAQGLFEGLTVAGWRNGVLFLHLGNTYLKRDALGEAIRAYRRAELFIPRDSDLRHNLAVARGQVAEPVGTKGPLYALRSLAFWYDLFTHRELALATVAAWVLVCVAVVWRYATRSVASSAATFVTLGLFVAMGVTWGTKHYTLTRIDAAIVVNGDAPVRAGPSGIQPVTFSTSEGTEVVVTARDGAYRRIQRADGRAGWVRSDQLAAVRFDDE